MSQEQSYTGMKSKFSVVEAENNYEQTKAALGRARASIHPSSASVVYYQDDIKVCIGGCLRASWYRIMQIDQTNPTPVGTKQKGRLGKAAEIDVISRWKEMGIWVGNNVKFFNKDYMLSGEMDAVIRDPNLNTLTGIEIKSFYDYPANRRLNGLKRDRDKAGGPTPGAPREHEFLQTITYAWEYRNEFDEYRMYYIERGDGHRLEFSVGTQENPDGTHQCWWEQVPGPYWNMFREGRVMRPYTIEDIYARYSELLDYSKQRKMPPRDYTATWGPDMVDSMYQVGKITGKQRDDYHKNPTKNRLGHWECSWCRYKDQCAQDELTAHISQE